MENVCIWLAVDSNGDERLTSNLRGFQRFSPKAFNEGDKSENKKVVSYDETILDHDVWIEYHDQDDVSKFGIFPRWNYLPKGTIEKIIGRKLTWKDDPVKVSEIENGY